MSTEWSNKGSKTDPVDADEVMLIDSEDVVLATKNKRTTKLNLQKNLQTQIDARELLANKVQDLLTPDAVQYPSTQAIVDALGAFDAISTVVFDAFQARFAGVFGTPENNVPAWTDDIPAGSIAIVTRNVFGINRKVVLYTGASGGNLQSELDLDAAAWQDIFDHGASFGGTLKFVSGASTGNNVSFFCGVGVSSANNPAVTGNRRYGMVARVIGGFIVLETINETFKVTLNGLNGNPKVLPGEYFKLEIVIPQTLGNADVFVNDVLLDKQIEFLTNSNTLDKVTIQTGASDSTDRVFEAENYGLTIYQSDETFTLTATELTTANLFIIYPPGKRDYEIIYPAGFPKSAGDRITNFAQNGSGTITFSSPNSQIAFESLNPFVRDIPQVELFNLLVTEDNSNKYLEQAHEGAAHIESDGPLVTGGDVSYNSTTDTFEFKGVSTILQVAHESYVNVVNNTGITLTVGQVVKILGYNATFDFFTVELAQADTETNADALGMITEEILDTGTGKATIFGKVNDLDTSTFTEGQTVFLDPATAGEITGTLPTAFITRIGTVGKVDAATGWIQIRLKVISSPVTISPFDTTTQYALNNKVLFEDIEFRNKTANTIGLPFDILEWERVNTSGTRIRVFNNTGATLNPLDVVFGNGGHDASIDGVTVSLSQADILPNSNVLGVVVDTILNGESGFVAKEGTIENVDTSAFTDGKVTFLSETVPGGMQGTRPSAIPIRVGHVLTSNAVSGTFLVHIGLLDISINVTAYDDTTVTFGTADTAQSIPFNNNGVISGISHSETVDNDEFTFDSPGAYTIRISAQFEKVSGGGTDTLSIYVQRRTSVGSFINIPFSTRMVSLNATGVILQSAIETQIVAAVGDVMRVIAQVTATTLELPAFAASGTPPDDIPETSSVNITISRA